MARNSRILFKIERNDVFGRYLVASEDIEAGEIIFTEDPIMLGPKRFSTPVCLGCHHSVNGNHFCSNCGFPMCTPACQNVSVNILSTQSLAFLSIFTYHVPFLQTMYNIRGTWLEH